MAWDAGAAGNKGADNTVSNTRRERCITGTTKVLGVIAHPVGHSLSPPMHNSALKALGLDYVYVAFNVLPKDVGAAVESIRALGLAGINVTIPHKEAVIEFLDKVSPHARDLRSVNTIVNDGGTLRGENTDGQGFLRALDAEGFDIAELGGSNVVVLGAGGSAKAIVNALVQLEASVTILNRTEDRARDLAEWINKRYPEDPGIARSGSLDRESLAEALSGAAMLVNTTSIGMHPNTEGIPCPPDLLRPDLFVYDIVYNPLETALIKAAKQVGAKTLGGVKMLVHQGAIAFEMWTGIEPPVDVMERTLLDRLQR